MKKISSFTLWAMALCLMFTAAALAEPASKATAMVAQPDTLVQLKLNNQWQTILTQGIKTPTAKDLFIDVALQTGLTTDTKVVSKTLAKALAMADAEVSVRVLVNNSPVNVFPNDVVFDKRKQTLIAQFAGYVDEKCFSINAETGLIEIDELCIEPESLQLILETLQANSFNFIVPDLPAGTHTLTIQVKGAYATNVEGVTIDDHVYSAGEAKADVYIGASSVTVETVRMIKGEDVQQSYMELQ